MALDDVADSYLIDTNILLSATDEDRSTHQLAADLFVTWPAAGQTLYTSGQVLREYLAVATRSTQDNGLGLEPPMGAGNVAVFRKRLKLADENDKVSRKLEELVESFSIRGKSVHDANLVATAIVHGIDGLATFNPSDFARFTDLVEVREPS